LLEFFIVHKASHLLSHSSCPILSFIYLSMPTLWVQTDENQKDTGLEVRWLKRSSTAQFSVWSVVMVWAALRPSVNFLGIHFTQSLWKL